MENKSKTFKYTKWWLIIIGIYYLINAVIPLGLIISGSSDTFRLEIPYEIDDNGIKAFSAGVITVASIIGTLGIAALFYARNPGDSRPLVFALVLNEAIPGVVTRIWSIFAGYPIATQGTAAIISLIFTVSGILILNRELKKTSP